MKRFKNFDRKKLLFCNIAWMREYRGATKDDKPIGGGKYVDDTGKAWEDRNFCVGENGMCYGYVQPPSQEGKYTDVQIRIERLGAPRSAEEISGITVIWTATDPNGGGRRVVGYYQNATVRRRWHNKKLKRICADKRDCRLFPVNKRHVNADAARCQSNIRYGEGISDTKFLAEIDNLLKAARSDSK